MSGVSEEDRKAVLAELRDYLYVPLEEADEAIDALIAAGWAPRAQVAEECAVIAERLLQPTAGRYVTHAIRTAYTERGE